MFCIPYATVSLRLLQLKCCHQVNLVLFDQDDTGKYDVIAMLALVSLQAVQFPLKVQVCHPQSKMLVDGS